MNVQPVFMNNLQKSYDNNLWPIEPTNYNYKTHLLQQVEYLLGPNRTKQYSWWKPHTKKWPKNASDLGNDGYELPTLKYNANQDKLVEQKEETPKDEEEGTQMEEEKEPKTPTQSASKEGEDSKSLDKECYKSNCDMLNCGIKTNVGHHHMFIIISTFTSENRQENHKYPIFQKNLKKFRRQHRTLLRS
jgi:hypothetical protein